MCGRLVTTHKPSDIAKELDAVDLISASVQPDYNVGPTRAIPAVLERRHSDEATGEVTTTRQLELVRWGLVPSWAKDPRIGNKMINARMETVRSKPAFRAAFQRRRCIVTASGFYEWQVTDNGKQPWFIYPPDNQFLTMAGLYETWRDAEGHPMRSCTIITTSATDDVGELHDRAPMIVERDALDQWLDPTRQDGDELEHLLRPAVPGTFLTHPVDKAVGNVRNNYPSLLDEVDPNAEDAEQAPLFEDDPQSD